MSRAGSCRAFCFMVNIFMVVQNDKKIMVHCSFKKCALYVCLLNACANVCPQMRCFLSACTICVLTTEAIFLRHRLGADWVRYLAAKVFTADNRQLPLQYLNLAANRIGYGENEIKGGGGGGGH